MILKLPSLASCPIQTPCLPSLLRNSTNDQKSKFPNTIQEDYPRFPLSTFPFTLLFGVCVLSFFLSSCLPSRASKWQSRLQTMTRTKEIKKLRIFRCCHHQNGVKTNPGQKVLDKCPWPGLVHVIFTPRQVWPFRGPHAARLGACGGPFICRRVHGSSSLRYPHKSREM